MNIHKEIRKIQSKGDGDEKVKGYCALLQKLDASTDFQGTFKEPEAIKRLQEAADDIRKNKLYWIPAISAFASVLSAGIAFYAVSNSFKNEKILQDRAQRQAYLYQLVLQGKITYEEMNDPEILDKVRMREERESAGKKLGSGSYGISGVK